MYSLVCFISVFSVMFDYSCLKVLARFRVLKHTILVSIFQTGSPDKPRSVEVTCEETRAKVKWISSFNGGDRQTFTVIAVNGQYEISYSNPTSDEGENVVHMNYVENLRSSTEYVFYVSAQNQHGNKSSENIKCKTLEIGIICFILFYILLYYIFLTCLNIKT